MGLTYVPTTVSNPAQPGKSWEGSFLADSGAIDCMVPGNHLRAIGFTPRAKRSYELADGTEVELEICSAELTFMDEFVGATIIFGPDDCEPILGVTAMESAGVIIDPKSRELKKLPAVSLKKQTRTFRDLGGVFEVPPDGTESASFDLDSSQ